MKLGITAKYKMYFVSHGTERYESLMELGITAKYRMYFVSHGTEQVTIQQIKILVK